MKISPLLQQCARSNLIVWTVIALFLPIKAFSQEIIILNVIVNEETLGVCFLAREGDDIWIKKEDVAKTKLRDGLGIETEFEGERYLSLRSMQGVTYKMDENETYLTISAPSHLFKSQSISLAYEKSESAIYPRHNSAFLNYGLLYDDETSLTNLSAEVGVRVLDYIALSTFNYDKTEDEERWTRLLTSVRTDSRKNLTTLILGDFAASGGSLGSSNTLGGVSFSKNYSINPYLLRFPALSLNGTVETPSEIEVYVNDQLVGRKNLNPGEFVLTDIPTTVGLGEAKIVIKDIYGNSSAVPTNFYYSDKLVKKGLHEYSYSIGLEREDLGINYSSYGELEVIASHAYGFSNRFKGGYAFEAGQDVFNAGPAATILLPFGGVIDAAFTFTERDGKSGYGTEADYLFQTRRVTAVLSLRKLSREFSSLSIEPSDDKPETQFNAAAGLSGSKIFGGFSLDYSMSHMHFGEDTEKWGLSYSKTLFKDMSLFARLSSADSEGSEEKQVYIGMHIYLDKDVSGALSYTDKKDDTIKKAGIQKGLPTAGGFGLMAEEEQHEGYADTRAEVQYQNDYGLYEAEYTDFDGNENYRLLISGGIGYIDGTGFLSRPIRDSFAKVKTGNLEGVDITHYGNVITTTNSKGEAMVPVLYSFHDNKIGIVKEDIPLDYNVESLSVNINPPYRSGSVVNFEVMKVKGFFGTVSVVAEGKKVPVEYSTMRITADGSEVEGLVGKGGEFYFENVPSGVHPAMVIHAGKECRFDLIIPESDEIMIDLGSLACRFQESLPVEKPDSEILPFE